jgi:anti-sigma-K factor RskA
MRYDDPELRDRLAAEYALGSLRGAARRRFERLALADAALAALAESWALRLNPLVEAVPPVNPPRRVWRGVARALGPAEPAGSRLASLWDSLGFWRGLGLAASALAALLLVYIGVAGRLAPTESVALAVLEDQAGHAAFVATAEPARDRLVLRAVGAAPVQADRSYQLWLIPRAGKPRPLGLVAGEGAVPIALSPPLAAALPEAAALAVSLEPRGGSPTGLPTGPVLYKGALLARR